MPVINSPIHQVPADLRGQAWGEAIGGGVNRLTDLLLQAILSGQFGQVPTGQSTLNLPGGGTATPGPGLQQQIDSGQLQQLIAQGQFPQGTTSTQQTRFGMRPNLNYQKTQAEIEKLQGDIAFQKQLPDLYKNIYGKEDTSSKIQQVEDDAIAGDEDAIAAYRYLKKIGAL